MKPSAETKKDDIVNAQVFTLTPRTIGKRAALLSSILPVLLMAASCAALLGPSPPERPSPLSEQSNKYRPLLLASGVPEQPGSLAWSPDGKTLAFIDNTVNFYDVESAGLKHVPLEDAHFLNWSTSDKLMVLSQELKEDVLCSIDRGSLRLTKTAIDSGAEAIYSTTDRRNFLVLSKIVRQFSFGTEVVLRVSARNSEEGKDKTLYTMDRTYPGKQLDLRFLMAWTHAGPNPVDDSMLIIEHAMPPFITPDSRAFGIDPLTGLDTDISDKTSDHVYISAGWSPDGRMVVLTDGNGYLVIRTVRGQEVLPWSLQSAACTPPGAQGDTGYMPEDTSST